MPRFEVHLDGYMPEIFEAQTRDKARYRAFLAYRSAWPCTFREFLSRCTSVNEVTKP